MKLDKMIELIAQGPLVESGEIVYVRREIEEAIGQVVWPKGAADFTIHAQSGKKRGEGNGVKPIKDACMGWLHKHYSWRLETRPMIGEGMGAGRLTPFAIPAMVSLRSNGKPAISVQATAL